MYVTQIRRKGILLEFGVLVPKKEKSIAELAGFPGDTARVLRADVCKERSQLLTHSLVSTELSTELRKRPMSKQIVERAVTSAHLRELLPLF